MRIISALNENSQTVTPTTAPNTSQAATAAHEKQPSAASDHTTEVAAGPLNENTGTQQNPAPLAHGNDPHNHTASTPLASHTVPRGGDGTTGNVSTLVEGGSPTHPKQTQISPIAEDADGSLFPVLGQIKPTADGSLSHDTTNAAHGSPPPGTHGSPPPGTPNAEKPRSDNLTVADTTTPVTQNAAQTNGNNTLNPGLNAPPLSVSQLSTALDATRQPLPTANDTPPSLYSLNEQYILEKERKMKLQNPRKEIQWRQKDASTLIVADTYRMVAEAFRANQIRTADEGRDLIARIRNEDAKFALQFDYASGLEKQEGRSRDSLSPEKILSRMDFEDEQAELKRLLDNDGIAVNAPQRPMDAHAVGGNSTRGGLFGFYSDNNPADGAIRIDDWTPAALDSARVSEPKRREQTDGTQQQAPAPVQQPLGTEDGPAPASALPLKLL